MTLHPTQYRCSGCVTSAETILVNQQSTEEFLSQLAAGPKLAVVTVSPQSRASLAAHFGIPQSEVRGAARCTMLFVTLPLYGQVITRLKPFLGSLGVCIHALVPRPTLSHRSQHHRQIRAVCRRERREMLKFARVKARLYY